MELVFEGNVSCETSRRINAYVRLLSNWQSKIRLVGDFANIKTHIQDCLSLIPYLNRDDKIIDIGSGAGLPGIILCCHGYSVTLVDSCNKKTIFLSEVIRQLELKAEVISKRIESLTSPASIIVARSLSSIRNILNWTTNIRNNGTQYLLFKGSLLHKEITTADQDWEFDCKILPRSIYPEGGIVRLSFVKSKKP